MAPVGKDTSTSYVTSVEELREILGEPGRLVSAKVQPTLDQHARDFIARSRFCLLATAGVDGTCDVSPRGEPDAVVRVLDDHTLVLPDRPGNRRLDSLRNILANPHVGMLFLLPPMSETLRLNGRARLVRDAPYLADLAVNGRPPRLAVEITVTEVYLHCAKAFLRSDLWDPQTWPDRADLPSAARILRDHTRVDIPVEDIDVNLQKGYRETLY
jgi:PPOX class probable FMN-dependent enzyme